MLRPHGSGRGCAGLTVTQQALNRTTSVHDLIEEKLFQTGGLVRSEDRSVDVVGTMATAGGLKTAVDDAASWMVLNRQSLRFSGYDGGLTDGEGGACVLEFELQTPSMLLLRLEGRAK